MVYLETLTGYTVLERPLAHHLFGLETATRCRSRYCVKTDDGRIRRVYITQFGNAGTAWVRYRGQTCVLRASELKHGDYIGRDK